MRRKKLNIIWICLESLALLNWAVLLLSLTGTGFHIYFMWNNLSQISPAAIYGYNPEPNWKTLFCVDFAWESEQHLGLAFFFFFKQKQANKNWTKKPQRKEGEWKWEITKIPEIIGHNLYCSVLGLSVSILCLTPVFIHSQNTMGWRKSGYLNATPNHREWKTSSQKRPSWLLPCIHTLSLFLLRLTVECVVIGNGSDVLSVRVQIKINLGFH